MGSKKKTHTDLSANRMFDDKDNMYIEELIRVVSDQGSTDSSAILPVMINDQMMFFNEAVFEKAGALSDVDMASEGVTNESIASYLIQNVDSTAETVYKFFSSDEDDKPVNSTLIKTLEALNDLYTPGVCSSVMYQTLNGYSGNKSYEVLYTSFYIESKEYRVKPVDIPDGIEPELTTDASNFLYVTMQEIDDTCTLVPDVEDIKVKIPSDDREVFAVDYHTTLDENKHVFVFTDYVMKEAESTRCFVLGLMKNFEWIDVEGDKYRKFLFARFGLGAEDARGNSLEHSMSEAEDLEIAFLTYATNRNDSKFGYLVENVYGPKSAPNTVTISGGHYNITYRGNGEEYSIYLDQGTFSADKTDDDNIPMPLYIIPTSLLKSLPMKDKFQAYNSLFSMWNYSEKVVKIKWYQTKLFRFVMFIVAIVITAITMGTAAAVTMLVFQVGMTMLQSISPELALILGVVIGVVTFNPNAIISSVNNVANSLIAIATHINQMAFDKDLASIKSDIDKYTEEEKIAAEAIEEIQKEAIWSPMSLGDQAIELGQTLPFLGPEVLYSSCQAEVASNKLYNMYPN